MRQHVLQLPKGRSQACTADCVIAESGPVRLLVAFSCFCSPPKHSHWCVAVAGCTASAPYTRLELTALLRAAASGQAAVPSNQQPSSWQQDVLLTGQQQQQQQQVQEFVQVAQLSSHGRQLRSTGSARGNSSSSKAALLYESAVSAAAAYNGVEVVGNRVGNTATFFTKPYTGVVKLLKLRNQQRPCKLRLAVKHTSVAVPCCLCMCA